jgi:hypothetical protein
MKPSPSSPRANLIKLASAGIIRSGLNALIMRSFRKRLFSNSLHLPGNFSSSGVMVLNQSLNDPGNSFSILYGRSLNSAISASLLI